MAVSNSDDAMMWKLQDQLWDVAAAMATAKEAAFCASLAETWHQAALAAAAESPAAAVAMTAAVEASAAKLAAAKEAAFWTSLKETWCSAAAATTALIIEQQAPEVVRDELPVCHEASPCAAAHEHVYAIPVEQVMRPHVPCATCGAPPAACSCWVTQRVHVPCGVCGKPPGACDCCWYA